MDRQWKVEERRCPRQWKVEGEAVQQAVEGQGTAAPPWVTVPGRLGLFVPERVQDLPPATATADQSI